MAHWQLGDKSRAREWYTPASLWMHQQESTDDPVWRTWEPHQRDELRELHAEAAALGLPDPSQAQKQAAPDDVRIYSLVLELNPRASSAYAQRGAAYAAMKQWDKAAADFVRAIELNAAASAHSHYQHALVRLAANDLAVYRKACADMLVRFGQSPHLDTGSWTTWTCVLVPDAVADWKVPLQLAEKGVTDKPTNYGALNNHGAVLYRAGQYEEALKRLTEAEAAYQPGDMRRYAIAYNWLFLAMAQQRLGCVEEAKKWLDKAVQWIDQEKQKKPKEPGAANRLPWDRRLTLQLLRREVEALLGSRSDK